MKLIIILICLLVMSYRPLWEIFRRKPGLDYYIRWIDSQLQKSQASSWAKLLLMLILPLLFLFGLMHIFDHTHARHLWHGFLSLFVLWYSWAMLEEETVSATTPREITENILWVSLPNTFAIVFWFVLLGPLGALLYYSVRLAEKSSVSVPANKLRLILEWPAARILGFGYALAGHFNPGFSYWSLHLFTDINFNKIFLQHSGLLALNGSETDPATANDKENYHAEALVNRAQIMLLVVLAIFTLGAWLY